MSDTIASAPGVSREWIALEKFKFFPGMIHGARQPSLLIVGRLAGDDQKLDHLVARLNFLRRAANRESDPPAPEAGRRWRWAMEQLIALMNHFIEVTGAPLIDPPRIMRAAPDETCARVPSAMLVPVVGGRRSFSALLVEEIVALIEAAAPDATSADLQAKREETLARLFDTLSLTQSRKQLLDHALRQDIPCYAVSLLSYQYGQGSRSCWFDTTTTERTSSLASTMAHDKIATHARLKQAGVAVPRQQLVEDAEDAVRVAAEFGYPVVIKPYNGRQGIGVSSDLRTAGEVREAFATASSGSAGVIVEEHIPGRDYRVYTFDDELAFVGMRLPAGVTGDGQRTIAELVEIENRDPRRGLDKNSLMQKIRLDEKAKSLLARDGMNENTVPPEGEFVRLTRVANISQGGTPVDVTAETHPDNLELAFEAARALRLDLSGVDLIMEDISRSWKEIGGAICEVNSGPEFGNLTAEGFAGEVVRHAVGGPDGRIPVIAVVGEPSDGSFAARLAAALEAEGIRAGWHDAQGVHLATRSLVSGPVGAFAAGEMLVTRRDVDAMILSFFDRDATDNGFACDRFDWVVLAGDRYASDAVGDVSPGQGIERLLSLFAMACKGTMAVLSDAGTAFPSGLRLAEPGQILEAPVSSDEVIGRIVAEAKAKLAR